MRFAFAALMALSLAAGAAGDRMNDMASAVAAAGERALSLGAVLCGSMAIWCGLAQVLRETGDDARLARLLRRLLAPLFPGISDDQAWRAMCMNISANMLGLGNAATPYGISAARLLGSPALGQAGLNALAMLLVLNNSGLQWIPTTVITLRAAAGSSSPTAVWLPTLISSGAATLAAVVMMLLIRKGERWWNARQRG